MSTFIFLIVFFITKIQTQSSTDPVAVTSFSNIALPRIINGTIDLNAKYLVSIRLKAYESAFGKGHICGGTLIGQNKVLTAAHCTFNSEKGVYRKPNEFLVVMGTKYLKMKTNETVVSDVASIAHFGEYDKNTMRHDIAIIFLKTSYPRNSKAIETIKISNITVPQGATCQVSGWGRTETGKFSEILLTTNVTIIDQGYCNRAYGGRILDDMLCAGRLLGGSDSCQGDSGGSLVHNLTLVGIVSWGSECGKPLFPGVYTSVAYYYEWIINLKNGKTKITYFYSPSILFILEIIIFLMPSFLVRVSTF